MRPRFLGSCVLAALALVTTGCPDDPDNGDGDTGRRDTGSCVAVDVGPSAPDGDEPPDATDDVSDAGDLGTDADDATTDSTTDATTDVSDATSDATDTDTDATTDADTTTDADAADVSFDTIATEFDAGAPVPRSAVDLVIKVSCVFGSCHGRPLGAGGLVMFDRAKSDWYPNLVGVKSIENPSMPYVDPGNPAGSWLAHKIMGDQCIYTAQCKDKDCGDQMPAANEPLDDFDKRVILDWIRQGAKRE